MFSSTYDLVETIHGSTCISTNVSYVCSYFFNRSKDEHNKNVKKSIEEEISGNKENVYSRLLVESGFFCNGPLVHLAISYFSMQELFKDTLNLGGEV